MKSLIDTVMASVTDLRNELRLREHADPTDYEVTMMRVICSRFMQDLRNEYDDWERHHEARVEEQDILVQPLDAATDGGVDTVRGG